jgi:hypothetical protein
VQFTLHSKVVRDKEHLSSQVCGETIILHIQSGQYYRLNGSASCIWNHLEVPVTVNELLRGLVVEYNVEESIAAADLLASLSMMEERGLIKLEENSENSRTSADEVTIVRTRG